MRFVVDVIYLFLLCQCVLMCMFAFCNLPNVTREPRVVCVCMPNIQCACFCICILFILTTLRMEFCCLCNKNLKTFSVVRPLISMQSGVCVSVCAISAIIYENVMLSWGRCRVSLLRRLPGPARPASTKSMAAWQLCLLFLSFYVCALTEERNDKKNYHKFWIVL